MATTAPSWIVRTLMRLKAIGNPERGDLLPLWRSCHEVRLRTKVLRVLSTSFTWSSGGGVEVSRKANSQYLCVFYSKVGTFLRPRLMIAIADKMEGWSLDRWDESWVPPRGFVLMTKREIKPLICGLMGHLLHIHSAQLNYPIDKLGMLVGPCKIGHYIACNLD